MKKYLPIGIVIVAVLILALFTTQGDAKEPVKSQAVIALEKEMTKDVPVYNVVVPRLKRNRAGLNALGWDFDDKTMKAVPLQ